MPLATLWNLEGIDIPATRIRHRDVDATRIRELLRVGPLRFVVAIGGGRLRWVEDQERFVFWKKELQTHLYRPDQPYLEDYPDEYFYFASEWRLETGESVILVEMMH